MSKVFLEDYNLDGQGKRSCKVYYLSPVSDDYWAAVTDVQCPCCTEGKIRWAEHLYVAGYRICDKCGRHFLASGDMNAPKLIRVYNRRG